MRSGISLRWVVEIYSLIEAELYICIIGKMTTEEPNLGKLKSPLGLSYVLTISSLVQ